MEISKKYVIITVIIISLILVTILIKLLFFKDKNLEKFNKLSAIKKFKSPNGDIIDLSCEPLSGAKRVYVSAGMFDLTDNIYSVGIGGLLAGKGFSAMAFQEVICGMTSTQLQELNSLGELWNVPWYGIIGEIDKRGWEAYCPVRDGFVMAPTIVAIMNMNLNQLYYTSDNSIPDKNSMFNKDNIKINIKNELGIDNATDQQCLDYIKNYLIKSVSISIGANDLFAMYSSCNCCVFNENGLSADSGGLAELGNLGARGVPITIMKGQITADFAGNNNPMPTMCSSAQSIVFPTLTTTPVTNPIYQGALGALDRLDEKIKNMLANKNNIFAFGDSNEAMPLPPLQVYWSSIGALSYFLKHKSKKIVTLGDGTGHINYDEDYTDFWKQNVVYATDKAAGYLAFGKKCGENLYSMQQIEQWRDIVKFWS